ncbi:ABC transporter permease [Rubellimicrobium roseum]|uniref:Iron chelate uptake ABC transporter family permease subunit n=1 Tax=Rubellimicrobium roseum TaxID=687525 RepID=A0A5C4NDE8_9RHOB|nr:iron chelate uptake ABC transporter family permease subunit [Rubellimicrobium roseum]TNC66609.1 iron chelate uptake ABC transporter family permease subunit [Rubellimicrobium roseum]
MTARVTWGAAALLAALSVASLLTGVIDLAPGDPDAWGVLVVSRLPRTLAVILTGASMAVAGLVMQMLVRNRFVEPTTAGTGQGAALGILLVTILWPGAPLLAQMVVASLCALLATAGFLVLVRRLPPTQPLLVPLVALVYGSVLGSVVMFIGYQLDLLQYVEVWTNGEFSGVLLGRYELLWLSGAVAVGAYFAADRFTIVGLGREASVSLGLDYERVVLGGLLIVAVVSALTVVTVGMIPFVGIIVPNVASRLLGDNLRATLPGVALLGSILVLACDLLGRLVRHPYEIPVGTVFGVVGALVFLALLYGRPGRAG